MGNKQAFKKYRSILIKEGIIKAAILGLIIGFSIGLVSAFTAFTLNNFNLYKLAGFVISLVIGLIAALISAPIFYFVLFRPDTRQIAARIDRLGLEERLITMLELEQDQSYIAMRQREDAKQKLNSFDRKKFKISVFLVPVIVLAIMVVCSATMVTISAAAFEDKIAYERIPEREVVEIPPPVRPEPDEIYDYCFIEYLVIMGGGFIDGDFFQVVVRGTDGSTVVATPFEGYVFKDWLQSGDEDPVRTELEVITNDQGDMAQFQPEGEGKGNSKQGKGESDKPDPGKAGDEGDFDANVIVDGESLLGDENLPDYIRMALERLDKGGTIPDTMREAIQLYFESLREEPKEEI